MGRVPRKVLWRILKKKEVPTIYVKIMPNMYGETKTNEKRVWRNERFHGESKSSSSIEFVFVFVGNG